MSTDNKNPNALDLDALNEELTKQLALLAMNPIVNALAQLFSGESPYIAAVDNVKNIAAGFNGPCKVEFSYNEPFEPNLEKYSHVLADKLDDFTFKALITKEDVDCTVNFNFSDFSFQFIWSNEMHHFVGHKVVGEMHDEHEFVYDECERTFTPLTSEVEPATEEETCSPIENHEDSVETPNDETTEYVDSCVPVECEFIDEKPEHDTSFADALYAKLNKKYIEDYFEKYKGDLVVALHRIFDYEMYTPLVNEGHDEVIGVRFSLEDVQKVCPNGEVGKFWEKISSQKIVGLVGDEFQFVSVMTYLDPETGNHYVSCKLKNC